MAIRHEITLSTTDPNNEIGLVKIRQADEETQTLVTQITENATPRSYEGLQVFFCAKLGQSLGLGIIEQKLNANEMTDPKNGKLEYTMRAEDWQQIGRQVGYFSFRKMTNDHSYVEQFTTRDFNFTVTKNVFSEGLTEVKKNGSTYVWTIEDLLRLFKEYMASGKSDWEEFVEQNREVLESVDPGGKLIGELIAARNGEANLKARLDKEQQQVNTQLAQKANDNEVRKKYNKIEPEDASDRLLSLMTGEGTIELKSEPQDGSVGPQSLDRNLTDILGVREENLFDSSMAVFGSVNSVDGTLGYVGNTTRLATTFISISPKRTIRNNLLSVTTSTTGNNVFMFYDENHNFLTTITTQEDKVEPPSGARYVRQNLMVDTTGANPELYWIGQPTSDALSELSGQIEQLSKELDMVDGFREIFIGEVINETVDAVSGGTSPVGGTSTGFMELNSELPIHTNAVALTTPSIDGRRYVFYDEFKNFLGSGRYGDIITPLAHSHYMRTNLSNYALNTEIEGLYFRQETKVANRLDNIETLISNLSDELGFAKENVIRVHDFYNSERSHTQIIKECMEFAGSLDNRIIILDTINWYIDEAILLPANTTVIVDGVTIKQNDEVFDNIFRGNNLEIDPSDPYGYPLSIEEITNIKIIGINGATLEGPDVNIKMEHPSLGEQDAVGDYWGWRCFHIQLSKASNFEIYGFNIRKTRSWALSFDRSHDYKVHDLDFLTTVKNGDGVDNRAGCYNFEIYNLTGSTSDDTVAMTAGGHGESYASYPRENYVYPLEPTRKENQALTKSELAIRNGSVYNIHTTGNHHSVICLAATGLQVHDISINNVKEPSPSSRESVVKLYTGYGSGYTDGDLHRIRVNDVLSKGADYAVQTNTTVDDVWFNKIVQEDTNGTVSSIADMNGVAITNS